MRPLYPHEEARLRLSPFPISSHFLVEMPRNARFVLTGQPYHVTQRGNNRQDVFFSAPDRELYLDLVRDNLTDAGVRVHAYCLMTNHVHWIVVPERGDSLAVLFRRVHGRYAQYLNLCRRCSGHLWQARFFSCVLSPAHLDVDALSSHLNPPTPTSSTGTEHSLPTVSGTVLS